MRSLAIATLVLIAQNAFSQEYFGEFKDPLKGEFFDATPRPKFDLPTSFALLTRTVCFGAFRQQRK